MNRISADLFGFLCIFCECRCRNWVFEWNGELQLLTQVDEGTVDVITHAYYMFLLFVWVLLPNYLNTQLNGIFLKKFWKSLNASSQLIGTHAGIMSVVN